MGTLLDFKIETHNLSFGNTDSKTIVFTTAYTTVPKITATAVNEAGSASSNLNVYVENVSTTQATIRISAIANATVHVQVIGN